MKYQRDSQNFWRFDKLISSKILGVFESKEEVQMADKYSNNFHDTTKKDMQKYDKTSTVNRGKVAKQRKHYYQL